MKRVNDARAKARANENDPLPDLIKWVAAHGLAPRIRVSDVDAQRLGSLLASGRPQRDQDAVAWLEAELGRAEVVPAAALPADVVCMNARVRYLDEDSGVVRDVLLVYPADADAPAGRISVLSPVGSALLGLSVGQGISWPMPHGRTRRLRVVAVLAQPAVTP